MSMPVEPPLDKSVNADAQGRPAAVRRRSMVAGYVWRWTALAIIDMTSFAFLRAASL